MISSYKETEGVDLLQLLYEHPEIEVAVDTESTGLCVTDSDYCIGVSIAFVWEGEGYQHYFGVNHPTGVNVSRETIDKLAYVLHQPRLLIFANVIFDILSLETIPDFGRLDDSDFIDVLVMAHLIDENTPKVKRLEDVGQLYLDVGKVSDPYIEQEKKSGNKHVTPEQMWAYGVMDAALPWRLWDLLKGHRNWVDLPDYFWPDKQNLVRVLLAMKRRGIAIDTELAHEYVVKGEIEMRRLGAELGYPAKGYQDTQLGGLESAEGAPLPVIGPKALKEIFIDRLGLPVVKMTKPSGRYPKGQISFDKEVMEEYDLILEQDDRPEAQTVKQYRGWQKAVSASYRPYLDLLESDGRLRCSYNLTGTVTGRLSSSEPNLQQIPKKSDKPWNGKVKECFIAEPGYTLLNADFSQLELRMAVAYADIPELKQVFEEGRDIFTEMSTTLGWERDPTKTFVYSTQYGAGEKRIMHVFRVTKDKARELRSNYFRTYPRFRMLNDLISHKAEQDHKVRIWTGRYRHFRFNSESYKAMNSVIQGGAADLVERCMVHCFRELHDEDKCRMLLQVHDSITFEVRNDLVEEYLPRIKAVMEDVVTYVRADIFDVTFAVEVGFWSPREEAQYNEWRLAA